MDYLALLYATVFRKEKKHFHLFMLQLLFVRNTHNLDTIPQSVAFH